MISDKGIALIIRFEGMKLKAYPDPEASGILWTIGVGHTGDVKEGDTCTEDEALEWLRQDCQEAEDCIDAYVTVELNQNQRDALIVFIYNIGCKQFKNSTMLRLLNAGDFVAAAQQFKRWNKDDGEVKAGLTKRREMEAKVFLT